jgi:hypothetical protein
MIKIFTCMHFDDSRQFLVAFSSCSVNIHKIYVISFYTALAEAQTQCQVLAPDSHPSEDEHGIPFSSPCHRVGMGLGYDCQTLC